MTKPNKRKANFGVKTIHNFANPPMDRRRNRLRLGKKVRIRPWAFLYSEAKLALAWKIGTIVKLRNGPWACVVYYPNVRWNSGYFGFDKGDLEVVKGELTSGDRPPSS